MICCIVNIYICIFIILVLSAMIRGADDGKQFFVRDYEENDLDNIFNGFFKKE